MTNALVPEFSVTDWRRSKEFYCEVLGFTCRYERPEEGFCYLSLGEAEIMLDQIGVGRTFDKGHTPRNYPFGKGLNVQIQIDGVSDLIERLRRHGVALYLDLEEKWYRVGDFEEGNRQFVVADPDGYLLRFYEDLGTRRLDTRP